MTRKDYNKFVTLWQKVFDLWAIQISGVTTI